VPLTVPVNEVLITTRSGGLGNWLGFNPKLDSGDEAYTQVHRTDDVCTVRPTTRFVLRKGRKL